MKYDLAKLMYGNINKTAFLPLFLAAPMGVAAADLAMTLAVSALLAKGFILTSKTSIYDFIKNMNIDDNQKTLLLEEVKRVYRESAKYNYTPKAKDYIFHIENFYNSEIKSQKKEDEDEDQLGDLNIYSISITMHMVLYYRRTHKMYLYFRNKAFADNFYKNESLPHDWDLSIPGVRMITNTPPLDAFLEIKDFFCEPKKEIKLLDTCTIADAKKNQLAIWPRRRLDRVS